MQFRSVRPSKGIVAAQNVVGSMNRGYAASLDASPNYTELAKQAIKSKSQERQAAMKAESQVARAGLEAVTDVNINQQDADLAKDVREIKKPARRMAGLVGALGLGAGYMVAARNMKLDREAADKRAATYDQNTQAILQAIRDSKVEAPQLSPNPEVPSPTIKPIPGPSERTIVSDSEEGPAADTTSQSAQPQSVMSRDQFNNAALSVGWKPEQLRTLYAISRGESGVDPSNDTKRLGSKGLYATTGEDSVGLMQINWGYHKDKGWLQNLGITKREQLYDPKTNLKAARYLYEQNNNFNDWTVYDKGIYKDYL